MELLFNSLLAFIVIAMVSAFSMRKGQTFSVSRTRLPSVADAAATWHRMVERKKIEVDSILRRVREADHHPLIQRMGYIADENTFNLTKAIKRFDIPDKGTYQTLSVICDMKRRSPTVPERRDIVDFDDAGKFSGLLVKAGIDALMVNTNEVEYGGCLEDIRKSFYSIRKNRPGNPAPIIAKDVILHPVQIAQAAEMGASAVLLIAAVLGGDLGKLLDACVIMGMEAVVEVHSPNELDYAMGLGASIFLVNQWDRLTGRFYPNQAKHMAGMFPFNTVRIVAGQINTVAQAIEFGYLGYDGVVLGRGITEMPDIKKYIDDVHYFRGHLNMAKPQQLPEGITLGSNEDDLKED